MNQITQKIIKLEGKKLIAFLKKQSKTEIIKHVVHTNTQFFFDPSNLTELISHFSYNAQLVTQLVHDILN